MPLENTGLAYVFEALYSAPAFLAPKRVGKVLEHSVVAIKAKSALV